MSSIACTADVIEGILILSDEAIRLTYRVTHPGQCLPLVRVSRSSVELQTDRIGAVNNRLYLVDDESLSAV